METGTRSSVGGSNLPSTQGVSDHESPSLSRPRLGFLGVGQIGRLRMEAIARSTTADIVAIADPDLKAAGTAQELAPGAVVRRGLVDLLAVGVDGVVIASPTAFHAEDAAEALRHGVAVFCQQPLGRHADETRQIVDAARSSNRLLAVDVPFRSMDGARRMRALSESGALGHIYAANLVFHSANVPDRAWMGDPRQSGGGCLMDLGSHLVDLALWTLGAPQVTGLNAQVLAEGRPLRSPAETAEDFAAVQLSLTDHRAVQLACSWKLQTGCDYVFEASFFGTRGGVSLRNLNGSLDHFVAERFTGSSRQQLATDVHDWHGRAAVEWTRRLATDPSFDPSVESAVTVAETIDRIRRSDENR